MADTTEREGGLMKNERLLLNVVCVVMALGFLGLAGLSYMASGSFLTTDNLFFITVAGMMALVFLIVPATSFLSARKAKKAPAGEASEAAAARGAVTSGARKSAGSLPARAPVRYADTVDARGRPIPPDVARMVATMKDKEPAP
jgi:hypothetical protein